MSIIGAHAIIYSKQPDADRAFLRDVLDFAHVDVGGGWLIFAVPPAEVAVHPSEDSTAHELYLMVDDVSAFVAKMSIAGVRCTEPQDQGWGVLTQLTLPGGGALGVYEPRHARPTAAARRPRATRKKVRKTKSVASKTKLANRKSAKASRGSATRKR